MNVARSGECVTRTMLCTRLDVFLNARDGDRINTKTWELQPDTWATTLTRTWFGMSRTDTISSIVLLYADCLAYAGDSRHNVWNKRMVTLHIKDSIPGMRVIRDTYKNSGTYDELETMIKKFCALLG